MPLSVLISGQSNALGRGTGGPSWSGTDGRVRVWNNINPLGANGTGFITAEAARAGGTFENTNRNNFGVWFCHRLAQIRDVDVDMTIVARGGTAIEAWRPSGSQPMLQECIDVWDATGQAPAHVFLWHQGEGNVSTSPAVYKADFLAMVSDLTAAGVIDAGTIIILGGLSEDNQGRIDFNNNVLREMADENEQIYYANSSGLSSYDGTHFTGNSLYTLGAERFFAAYADAEGFAMADLFALVNEGGTPGVEGSGENKLYNLLNLALIGMGKKDITTSPDYTGTPPMDNLLLASMLAAGALVDYGTDVTNGSWLAFESGFQVCWNPLMLLTRSSANSLSNTWTYGRPFYTEPTVLTTLSASNSVSMSQAKRAGSISDFAGLSANNVIIRMQSDGLYTTGDEAFSAAAIAIGWWK